MSQSDDQGRSESYPRGPGGDPQQGPPQYGQPQQHAQQYGQPQQGHPGYGEAAYPQQFTTPVDYGQQYGQQYGQPAGYGQQYGQYGSSAAPAKPAGVITAAVLGFVFAAIGALLGLVGIVAGAAASGAGAELDEEIPGFGSVAGAVGGLLLVLGLLALAWTVVMVWGSVWALTGRSRVLLLVGGSIAVALTAIGFLSSLAEGTTGDVVGNLVFLLASVAIVVLLAMRPAAEFFAAHRARRSGR
ncbi:proline-rich domain-containing protein [Blastococcus xanthinilyticus]|uniref:Uncharacterized protein n=1 Tax=Blastococcus xanthinilyticus TaxID=1564164 RepID=A0A5S5CUG5_9ACTN|nr:proline-rich domain-containing protein [Blastococcus xanthinilyticus]TYP85969.1 hypothetical protein BD833_111110 [Blastococcus xanthinilyticus]